MLDTMMGFVQGAVEFSMLGCVEVASVALIVYYVYAKTRAPAIIAGLFPNLNLNINYRSSLVKFNNMGNELLVTLRSGTKSEPKPENALKHGAGTSNMLEVTPHAGRKPFGSRFDIGIYFPFVAQNLRTKKFHYPQVSELVQKDPVLQRAIKQSAEQILREQRASKGDVSEHLLTENESHTKVYQQILKSQERRANSILKDMRSTLNNFLLALTSWLLYKLLPCFLSGVVTHPRQIRMLQAASERNPGIPLIFLPLHRSHLDYIMVTFILTNNDIRSPLVAAGNNLQIPVFGELLRGLGAFFIKRKIDPAVGKKDILYRAVLHLYLQHALKQGHNVEFFIEGGRTRTGKPCMPKGGILSVIVNAFMDKSIPDALLVPVSVNYERLVDGNFVREQKGEKKVPETFGKAMSGIWKALNSNYGLMRIDFNQPYSIRELVESYNKLAMQEGSAKLFKPAEKPLQHNRSTSSLYGTDVVCEEHRTLIDSISRQVVYDCAAATSVMSTNALAFLLLTKFRGGASDKDIAKSLDELRNALTDRRDMAFAGDSLHIIHYACDLLGKGLVDRTVEEGISILRPVPTVESFIELAYYSNMLTPHFSLQSILLTTFYSLMPNADTNADITNTDITNADKSNADKTKKNETNADKTNAYKTNADKTNADKTKAGKTNAGKTNVVDDDSESDISENVPKITRTKLIETALENCDIFRYEYILNKPTQVLEHLLELALDEIVHKGYINQTEIPDISENILESRRIAKQVDSFLCESDEDIDDSIDEVFDENEQYKPQDVSVSGKKLGEQRALCDVLAPFSHSYLAVAQSLNILYQNSMLETEFIKFVINDLSNKVKTGACPYAESISTDSVRNCLKLLEKWCVIEICTQHGLRLLSLGAVYETSKDSVEAVVQRIAAIVPNYKNGHF